MDLSNLGSGRFWFTLITAAVFGYCSFAKVLNGEQIVSIIMLVVTFYFGRTDRQPPTNGGVTK